MARTREDDPDRFPPLGRRLMWIEKPGSKAKLVTLLILIGALFALADLTYDKYGHFAEEAVAGFQAMFGFVIFILLVLAARGMRVLVGDRQDFYGDRSIDTEESYPSDQTELKDFDDD